MGLVESARTPADNKRLASLIAAFALKAMEVHELCDGGFLIVSRGITKHVASIAQLEAAALRLGITT